MEAVLTVIAAATMLGVPIMVVLMLKVVWELSRNDLTKGLLNRQSQFLLDKPLAISGWLGAISSTTLVAGIFIATDPVYFTDYAASIWIFLMITCLIAAHILERRAKKMEHDTRFDSGGGV